MKNFYLLILLVFYTLQRGESLNLRLRREASCRGVYIKTDGGINYLSMNCPNDFKTELKCAKEELEKSKVSVTQIKYNNCTLLKSPTNNPIEILKELNITHPVDIIYNGTNYLKSEHVSIKDGVMSLEISTDTETMKDDFLQYYKSVTDLKLSFSNLQIMPIKMLANLKKLKSLDWTSTNKTIFNDTDYPNEEKLELETIKINISGDKVDAYKPFPLSFVKMSHLKKIILQNSFGKSIDENFFEGAENVEEIEITGNRKLENLPPKLFKDQKNLKILNLEGNRLKGLQYALFSNLPNLRFFNVLDNEIKEPFWVNNCAPNAPLKSQSEMDKKEISSTTTTTTPKPNKSEKKENNQALKEDKTKSSTWYWWIIGIILFGIAIYFIKVKLMSTR